MAANLIMQLPAQNPPGFASDWDSWSKLCHWSAAGGSSTNQSAASGARGGLAIRPWYPIHGPEIQERKQEARFEAEAETSYLLFASTGGSHQTADDSFQTNSGRFQELTNLWRKSYAVVIQFFVRVTHTYSDFLFLKLYFFNKVKKKTIEFFICLHGKSILALLRSRLSLHKVVLWSIRGALQRGVRKKLGFRTDQWDIPNIGPPQTQKQFTMYTARLYCLFLISDYLKHFFL